ncbi:peptidase M24, structural domain-containing protein [Mycotypha africana]|uniref:peptidase M24, structural domain-containing protein n=1 Tax=Mycotypha africana TaxID=64632 RepID=UPI0023012B1F|nr:peptidase M24, structural domain-containing protein [Mycotypha africana]KAI8972000.1 peptidase M24, structural domain-containing protein [Mycotypha africana]
MPSFMPPQDKIKTRYHYLRVKKYLDLPPKSNTVIYHRGGVTHRRDDTDVELDFRQESNFFYLTGVESAGYHVIFQFSTDTIYLVRPTVPLEEQLWKGIPPTDQQLLEKYDVDIVLTENEMNAKLQEINPDIILTMDSTNVAALPPTILPKIDASLLGPAIHEARLIKFPWEKDLLRYTAHISSHAHISLMSAVGRRGSRHGRPFLMNESELEAEFRYVCAKSGLNRQCYIPIIASGERASVLHYTDNNKWIPSDNRHALILVDAGGELTCYGSDITRTFPVTGKFSSEARTIYNIVLKAQKAVLDQVRPGVFWRDMHTLVVKILTQELINIGILVGDAEEIIQLGIYRAFYFHGTGHSIGLDCHDVGGTDIGILSAMKTRKGYPLELFTRPLQANMVITVEPGLYFNDVSIDMWTAASSPYKKYFGTEKIEKYRKVGGVRIEDTILITEIGIENLTIAPKEVNDIEAIMGF